MGETQVCSYFVCCLLGCLYRLENSLTINFIFHLSTSRPSVGCVAEGDVASYIVCPVHVK